MGDTDMPEGTAVTDIPVMVTVTRDYVMELTAEQIVALERCDWIDGLPDVLGRAVIGEMPPRVVIERLDSQD